MNGLYDKFIKCEHRRFLWHIWKSRSFLLGIEHFLAMLPSMLVMVNISRSAENPSLTVLDLSAVMCACGIATMAFVLGTKPRVPFFLGPSFAYIGFIQAQAAHVGRAEDLPMTRYTVFWGFIVSAILLALLCRLYRIERVQKGLDKLLPYSVMGPSISLIGLGVVDRAVKDSGLNVVDEAANNAGLSPDERMALIVSMATLSAIILFSLLKIPFIRGGSVFFGVLFGCLVAAGVRLHNGDFGFFQSLSEANRRPSFPFDFSHLLPLEIPDGLPDLFLQMFFPVLLVFMEVQGRIAVYQGMRERYEDDVEEGALGEKGAEGAVTPESVGDEGIAVKMANNIHGVHAAANGISSVLAMSPCTVYAENLALMNLHMADSAPYKKGKFKDEFIRKCYDSFSIYPYVIASVICVVLSFFGGLMNLVARIPTPVFGGMELFLFGLIAAPGIQILVEQDVDLRKISNQIVMASVLIAGIGSFSLRIGTFSLSGMGLGMFVGIVVNLVTLVLGKLGILNERLSFDDILFRLLEMDVDSIRIQRFAKGESSAGQDGAAAKNKANAKIEKRSPLEWKKFFRERVNRKKLEDHLRAGGHVVIEGYAVGGKLNGGNENPVERNGTKVKDFKLTWNQKTKEVFLRLRMKPEDWRVLSDDNPQMNISELDSAACIVGVELNENVSSEMLRIMVGYAF